MDRKSSLRKVLHLAAPAALAVALVSCGGGGEGGTISAAPSTSPSPSPTPMPVLTSASIDVTPCLNQVWPDTNGTTLANLFFPDTIKLDPSRKNGYPNGRLLGDPVIDMLLAAYFLDINASGQSIMTLANLPLNPGGDDRPILTEFPFLGPSGDPTTPLAATTGTTFDFRSEPASAFTRVERGAQPAVSTTLIGSALKIPYNEATPVDDAAGTFRPEIIAQLTGLTNALADDLTGLGLQVCAKPS